MNLGENIDKMIHGLRKLLERDAVTPTEKIESGTLVCAVETLASGQSVYYQFGFESLPEAHRPAYLGKKKGDLIGKSIKIVGIYDVWEAA